MGVTSVGLRVACIASAFVSTMMAISERESRGERGEGSGVGLTIVGAGAIGGVTGAQLARAGH